MRSVGVALLMLCVASWAYAESNDAVLNLRDPAATSALFPTIRIIGPSDNGVNPSAKVPVLICRANAVAPTWTEGAIVPCSVDLNGNARFSLGSNTSNVNIVALLGIAPSVTNPFPQRLSTGTAFYDARDRNWTLSSTTDSVAVVSAVPFGAFNEQAATLFNSVTTGAANTAVVVTVPGVASVRALLHELNAACSGIGTSSVTVMDGATTIWQTNANEVTMTRFLKQWPNSLTGSTGATMTITLNACGGVSTGTLQVEASRG